MRSIWRTLSKAMTERENDHDEDIGRPGPWGEGRYHRKGQPDQSVRTPAGSAPTNDTPVSTPVTRKDYEFAGAEEHRKPPEPPEGDGG
jgi:hypothetical protein